MLERMSLHRPEASEATRAEPVPASSGPIPWGADRRVVGALRWATHHSLGGLLPGRAPTPFARVERRAFCDTALAAGAEAPTRCGDWDVGTLVAHLLVRERTALGAAGLFVPPLEPLTERAMRRWSRRAFTANLARLRRPGVSPAAVPALDRIVNTLEFFVHHEDVRRAGDGGPPRSLPPRARQDLWLALRVIGGTLVRGAGMPVALRRTDPHVVSSSSRPADDGDPAATAVLRPVGRRGGAPVTVVGDTGELVLFCYGRGDVADVRLEGDEVSVRRLRNAGLGI